MGKPTPDFKNRFADEGEAFRIVLGIGTLMGVGMAFMHLAAVYSQPDKPAVAAKPQASVQAQARPPVQGKAARVAALQKCAAPKGCKP